MTRPKTLSAALAALLAGAPLLAAQARPLAADDFARLHEVSDPSISPDGRRVVYTVKTVDLAKDKNFLNVWIATLDGKDNRPLTHGEHSQSHARWSPDGRRIAFVSARGTEGGNDERDQLWILPADGGEAEQVGETKGDIEDFAWSPDATRLVLVVRDPEAKPADGAKHTTPPVVIDRLRFMHDREGYVTGRFAHLALLEVASHAVTPLTTGAHDDLFPVWSPDSQQVAFLSPRGEDTDRVDDWSLLAIPARAGSTERLITKTPQVWDFIESNPPLAWSPDGKSLAFVHGGAAQDIEYAAHSLATVSATGGAYHDLAPTLDRNVQQPHYAPDGRSILALLEDDGVQSLVRFPIGGGSPVAVLAGERVVDGFDVARSGALVVTTSTPDRPGEVYALDGKQLRPLSKQNDAWLKEVDLGPVDRMAYKSQDGTEIHAWLTHPAGHASGARSAAYLNPHGGPQAQSAAQFSFAAQLFAANGYLVIQPNYRGSTGRGSAFGKALAGDWGHLEVEDDLAAVDDAVSRGLADPERLIVGGWSYGGISTNYLIASTTRFKAAVTGASISNILAGYGTDEYVTDYEHELGTPWAHTDRWLKLSYPFLKADRIKTPTLFLCGDKDMNVPLTNSEQMYQALRSLGVPTQLVIYPGQFHGLTTPSYILDRYQRQLAWYAKYVHTN